MYFPINFQISLLVSTKKKKRFRDSFFFFFFEIESLDEFEAKMWLGAERQLTDHAHYIKSFLEGGS